MTRFLSSLFVGLLIGAGIGLGLGWWGPEPFSVVIVDNPLSDLDQQYKDEYTVMIAGGYLADGDVDGVIARLSLLGVDNVPAYVQETAERLYTLGANCKKLGPLFALSEDLGRYASYMDTCLIVAPLGSSTP